MNTSAENSQSDVQAAPYEVTVPQALSMLRHEHLHARDADIDRIRTERGAQIQTLTGTGEHANRLERLQYVYANDLTHEPDFASVSGLSHHGSQRAAEIVSVIEAMAPEQRAEALNTLETITNRQMLTASQSYKLVLGDELEPSADQIARYTEAITALLEGEGIPNEVRRKHRLHGTTVSMLVLELRTLPTQRREVAIQDMEAEYKNEKHILSLYESVGASEMSVA